jgi:hypothetical protein
MKKKNFYGLDCHSFSTAPKVNKVPYASTLPQDFFTSLMFAQSHKKQLNTGASAPGLPDFYLK